MSHFTFLSQYRALSLSLVKINNIISFSEPSCVQPLMISFQCAGGVAYLKKTIDKHSVSTGVAVLYFIRVSS